jgi:hypothetical protein
MNTEDFKDIFTRDVLKKLFPEDRSDRFFDALLGDPTEGAFNIRLEFKAHGSKRLEFELHLTERPGKCLSCSLTYGLPEVFARHPIINIKGMVQDIAQLLDGRVKCGDWQLGPTREVSQDHHVIPLIVSIGS